VTQLNIDSEIISGAQQRTVQLRGGVINIRACLWFWRFSNNVRSSSENEPRPPSLHAAHGRFCAKEHRQGVYIHWRVWWRRQPQRQVNTFLPLTPPHLMIKFSRGKTQGIRPTQLDARAAVKNSLLARSPRGRLILFSMHAKSIYSRVALTQLHN